MALAEKKISNISSSRMKSINQFVIAEKASKVKVRLILHLRTLGS